MTDYANEIGAILASHSTVEDTDTAITVNVSTREFELGKVPTLIGIIGDHNSNVVSFKFPKCIDNHEIAECAKKYVIWRNKDTLKMGRFDIEDIKVNDDGSVLFGWLISAGVTQDVGEIEYCIKISDYDEYGKLIYKWNSKWGNGLFIADGYVDDNIEFEEPTVNTPSSFSVQADHAQNDPTKPDYIKNRLAYDARKFEDVEAVEYPEPIFGLAGVEEENEETGEPEFYGDPIWIKLAEPIENASSNEVAQELIGISFQGEGIRIDDPEIPPEILEALEKKEYYSDEGELLGTSWGFMGEFPYICIIDKDDAKLYYHVRFEEDGEVEEYDFYFVFPEKGIYTAILDSDTDENGNEVYYSYDKLLFGGIEKLDPKFLPNEALNKNVIVDDNPEHDSYNPISSNFVASLQDRISYALEIVNGLNLDVISLKSNVEGYNFTIQNMNSAVSGLSLTVTKLTDRILALESYHN